MVATGPDLDATIETVRGQLAFYGSTPAYAPVLGRYVTLEHFFSSNESSGMYSRFTPDQYRELHPGGSLGKSLIRVGDIMHRGDELPLVGEKTRLRDALHVMTEKRFGCVGTPCRWRVRTCSAKNASIASRSTRRRAVTTFSRARLAWRRCETPSGPERRQCWSPPVAAGGRDSSASDVIASAPRAASSSTSVASSPERA